MVGFSIKKKDDTKKTGFSGFKLGKANKNDTKKTKKPFGFTKDEDEEVKTTKIDTFDSNDGAFNKDEGPKRDNEPLVIKNEGNQNWKTKSQQRFNPNAKQPTTSTEPESKKLQYGINYNSNDIPKNHDKRDTQEESEALAYKQDVETAAEEATSEDYEKIPVDSFGAAMLRGMGWKGEGEEEEKDKLNNEKKTSKPVIPVAQRTLYLGLGAKDDGKERDPNTPVDKSYVPVRMIQKSRTRERSPIRSDEVGNFRSRS